MNYPKIRSNLKKVYDDLATVWGEDIALLDFARNDIDTLAKGIGEGSKVLDMGCGSGHQAKLLASNGLDVVGIDLSSNMISEARKRVPEATFEVGDITKMKFEPKSFDAVYAMASLLHIPKKLLPGILTNVYKILKDGGIFYLAVKKGGREGDSEKDGVDRRYGRRVVRFFALYEKLELEEILKVAGFKINSISIHSSKNSNSTWLKVFVVKK